MKGREPHRRKGSGAQSRPAGSEAPEDTFALLPDEAPEAETGAPPEHAPAVEGADAPPAEEPPAPAEPAPEPDPTPVPNARKYVVRGPNHERFVTYDRDEAREFAAYGRLIRKRKK